MEARISRAAVVLVLYLSLGANYRTNNFLVQAPTQQLAKEVGDSAEYFRKDLAIQWLGHELPRWSQPCPIRVKVGAHLGAGGATSFMFDRGQPYGWRMSIQGSRQRLLDSVLPHEITHTVFATHFGRPLPRWADEGACTTVEHVSERRKQHRLLIEFLTSSRGIAFNRMFQMKEYPADILPLYAQGYSLARFLISLEGRRSFIEYVGQGMESNNWTAATRDFYGIRSLKELQNAWLAWIRQGCPNERNGNMLAARNRDSGSVSTNQAATSKRSSKPGRTPVALVSDNRQTKDTASSWYARQRNRPSNAERRHRAGETNRDSEIGGRMTDDQRLAKPQSIQSAQELILDWGPSMR